MKELLKCFSIALLIGLGLIVLGTIYLLLSLIHPAFATIVLFIALITAAIWFGRNI